VTAWIWADGQIARNPVHAPIPAEEIAQYVRGRWSAEGFDEVVALLRRQRTATAAPVLVFAPLYSRPGVYSLMLAARRDPGLVIVPVDLGSHLPRAIGAIRNVVQRARTGLGPHLSVFILLEGLRSDEAATLRAGGLLCHAVVDHRNADGVSGFALLECDAGNL
jgi:hypothetical protein